MNKYEFRANPFETPSEDKAVNLAAIKKDRELFEEEHGHFGSDGVVADALSGLGLKTMDGIEQTIEGARDMASELGGLVLCLPGLIKDKLNKNY